MHTEKYGVTDRVSFSRNKNVLGPPNLIDIQTGSFDWFVKKGIKEVFEDISPIKDYAGSLVLEFVDYYSGESPKYTIQEAKDKDTDYSRPLKVKVRLTNTDTEEVKEQEVFMGDFPLMTDSGTFIINGAERVIVSQLVRSPGVYFAEEIDKSGNSNFASTVILNRGAWLEMDTDADDVVNIRIDRTRKLPVTILLRALLFDTDDEIIEAMGDSEILRKTLEKEISKDRESALIEIYKKLKPGDPASLESTEPLINNMSFDSRRYDLAEIGHYKFDKKLSLKDRITNQKAKEDVVDTSIGETLATAGDLIVEEMATEIENIGINVVDVAGHEGQSARVIGNYFVDLDSSGLDMDLPDLNLSEKVYYPIMEKILEESDDEKSIKRVIEENVHQLSPIHIIHSGILASIDYEFNLFFGIGSTDDIDHLGNRRVRTIGELLQNQFRISLSRMERVVREGMSTQDPDLVTPQSLINVCPVTVAIKEFFGPSQLSQFMEQTNPLVELAHKRRLSALGPGGLSRDRAGVEVRDVRDSHYGGICPIETPEGPNIGLITSMAAYSTTNEYGFLETSYRRVDKETGEVTEDIVYLTADEEDKYIIAQANEPLDGNSGFINERVSGRGINGENDIYPRELIDYIDVSPQQIASVGTAMIPFLKNDGATRALMGSNMQRQAVPLLATQAPIIGTGIEHKAAKDSGVIVKAKHKGTVTKVSSDITEITRDEDRKVDEYTIRKFKKANQGTTFNQRPIVNEGDKIDVNDITADDPSIHMGEMALGENILITFMTWGGYNYEGAMLLSEKLVVDGILTSVRIEEHESEARETKLGAGEITKGIPDIGEGMRKSLDDEGIIRIGAEVRPGDISIGKVTPKGETELSAGERLLRAIFGEKARGVRDTSLRVPHGESGVAVDAKIYSRANGDELSPGVNKVVRVFVAAKGKIMVGDKICSRHGNKGIVSRIMPEGDMPCLPDGIPIQIVLNPSGVPSRMNIGQVPEVHLGLAASKLGWKVATPVFDGANDLEVEDALEEAGYPKAGKIWLRDSRTGEYFDSPVTVGYIYMLKLHHIVAEKIHVRPTGPYPLVTQQPLGDKAQFDGQGFGEMEVWALEAYGAAHALQEILTVRSDDIVSRVKTYEVTTKGENIPEPGIPESFKVLIKELQSLLLNVKLLGENNEEVELIEEDDDSNEFGSDDRL